MDQIFWCGLTALFCYGSASLFALTDYAFTPPVTTWYTAHWYIMVATSLLLLGLAVFLYYRQSLRMTAPLAGIVIVSCIVWLMLMNSPQERKVVPPAALASGALTLGVLGLEVGGHTWTHLHTFWSRSVLLLSLAGIVGLTVTSAFAFREPQYTLTLDPKEESSYAQFVILQAVDDTVTETKVLPTPVHDVVTETWSFQYGKVPPQTLLAYRVDIGTLLNYMRSQNPRTNAVSVTLDILNDAKHHSFIRRNVSNIPVSEFNALFELKTTQKYAPTQRLSRNQLGTRSSPFYYYIVSRSDTDGVIRWQLGGHQNIVVTSLQ